MRRHVKALLHFGFPPLCPRFVSTDRSVTHVPAMGWKNLQEKLQELEEHLGPTGRAALDVGMFGASCMFGFGLFLDMFSGLFWCFLGIFGLVCFVLVCFFACFGLVWLCVFLFWFGFCLVCSFFLQIPRALPESTERWKNAQKPFRNKRTVFNKKDTIKT